MLKEFKEFIIKGNMFDLAVGVIIGAAFGKVVAAFTELLLGTVTYFVGSATVGSLPIGPKNDKGAQIDVGPLINGIINLLIVGFALFLFVKAVNQLRRKEAAPTAPAAPPAQEVLLTEIRDLLKK